MTKIPSAKTAIEQMDMASRIRVPMDLTLEFRYAIMSLLGGPMGRRLAVQLLDPRAYTAVKVYVQERFPIEKRNVLRRFLSGEFTGGVEPVHIPNMQKLDVEKLLRVMDVIEGMARDHDAKIKQKESQHDQNRNAPRGAATKRHNR